MHPIKKSPIVIPAEAIKLLYRIGPVLNEFGNDVDANGKFRELRRKISGTTENWKLKLEISREVLEVIRTCQQTQGTSNQ